jgi:hypothetical protein
LLLARREIVDKLGMADKTPSASRLDGAGEVEFFGVKLKVNNPRLAALLNSDVTDEVTVVVQRARGVFAADEPDAADASGDAADALVEQTIADAAPADVQLRRADVQFPPGDYAPLGALVEHPA